VGLATPPRAASPPANPETPRAGRSPSLSTTELPQEPNASPGSGVTTPKAGQGEGGTGTPSRYSKLSLGFPPLPGFFRPRNSPTIPHPWAKPATETAEEAQEGGAFVDVPPSSSEGAESGRAGKAEDEDDRRTIKGVVVDTAEQSADPELKQGGNGATSTEEKIPDATSLTSVSTVVAIDSFI